MKKISELCDELEIYNVSAWKEITGITLLDQMITPSFKAGNLIVLGSIKNGGKTLLALQMASFLAEYGKHSLLYFALKESNKQLTKRLLAQRFDPRKVFGREPILESDNNDFKMYLNEIAQLSINIEDKTPISVEEIEQIIWSFAQENTNSVVIVDSLQQFGTINWDKPAQLKEWGDIAAQLKQSAQEESVCVILTCEFEKNPTPAIQNIIGGRGIDQAADVILQIHHPAFYEDDITADNNLTEIHILKNRCGAEGIFNCKMCSECLLCI